MDFTKNMRFSVQANQSKDCQEYEFKLNSKRDTEYEYDLELEFDGFKENVTVCNGSMPWYASSSVHFFFALFM